jgi:hypothetical protein
MLEKQQPLQQMVGKLNIHIWKTEARFLSLTLHKNEFKWIKDLKIRPGGIRENDGGDEHNQGTL